MLKIIKIYKKFYLYYEEDTWVPRQPYKQDCYKICNRLNVTFSHYSSVIKLCGGKFYSTNSGFSWHSFNKKQDAETAITMLKIMNV